MAELKKEQYALSDEDLEQVSGGVDEYQEGWTVVEIKRKHCKYCNQDVDGLVFKEDYFTVYCPICHREIDHLGD